MVLSDLLNAQSADCVFTYHASSKTYLAPNLNRRGETQIQNIQIVTVQILRETEGLQFNKHQKLMK